jgi:lambda repressor-like predicted transcriptional regulator
MSWFKKIFTPPNKSIQGENRNRAALRCLQVLAFGQVEIRKALVELNGVKVKNLARVDGVSAATIYNTIRGRRSSPKAKELLAASLSLGVDDLFPNVSEPQACMPEAPDRQP